MRWIRSGGWVPLLALGIAVAVFGGASLMVPRLGARYLGLHSADRVALNPKDDPALIVHLAQGDGRGVALRLYPPNQVTVDSVRGQGDLLSLTRADLRARGLRFPLTVRRAMPDRREVVVGVIP